MSRRYRTGAFAAALTLSLLASAASASTTYHLTDLGRGVASGVNDLGQVVGSTIADVSSGQPSAATRRGFVLDTVGGGMQFLAPTAGFDTVIPTSINNAGQIVGALSSGNAQSGITESVFLYSPGSNGSAGSMKTLGTLGGTRVYSVEIGNGGHVVGLASDASGLRHMFFGQPGADTLEKVTSSPLNNAPDYVLDTYLAPRVNASGQFTLSYTYMNGGAYVSGPNGGGPLTQLKGGAYQHLLVTDINDQGRMVGATCFDGWGCDGALVNADGSLSSIADPFERVPYGRIGVSGRLSPSELNDVGQIAGSFSSSSEPKTIFLSQADGKNLVAIDDLALDNPEVLAQLKAATQQLYPGIAFSSIAGLNNLGQLVLNGANGDMYLLSPVPEPATMLSMLIGLTGMAGLAARARRERAPAG